MISKNSSRNTTNLIRCLLTIFLKVSFLNHIALVQNGNCRRSMYRGRSDLPTVVFVHRLCYLSTQGPLSFRGLPYFHGTTLEMFTLAVSGLFSQSITNLQYTYMSLGSAPSTYTHSCFPLVSRPDTLFHRPRSRDLAIFLPYHNSEQ